jgi:cytochrome P450
LARDASIYPDDPMRFYPERFLNDELDKPLAGHWAFGMGRRGNSIMFHLIVVCAGYVLAMKNLWISMAKLMYCFDVALAEVCPLGCWLISGREGIKVRSV